MDWTCPLCDDTDTTGGLILKHACTMRVFADECACAMEENDVATLYLKWNEAQGRYVPTCRVWKQHMCTCPRALALYETQPVYADLEIDTPQGKVHINADMCKLFHLPK